MTQEFEGATKLFRKLWAKLIAAGWKARKPSGLSDDHIYVRPGVSGRLKLLQRGVDYFVDYAPKARLVAAEATLMPTATGPVLPPPPPSQLPAKPQRQAIVKSSRGTQVAATELTSRARAVPKATELSRPAVLEATEWPSRARAVPEATEWSNRARDVPEATELVDLEAGHYDTLEDFDDGAFLDAMRREVLLKICQRA
ncbi:unnamed protein product [Phytophthora fragariaefolia]|uniref:Unnamed protein product n=1 Tax=Phytophthora fragariaefolia TaxID=1490495 RepID=A0A9W7CTI1_9STRA|nr:unnamed protein product [Phytophthora fragariaefolia]